jgi:DNA-binding transcriptional regulator/RsmH inhibitor MraZ
VMTGQLGKIEIWTKDAYDKIDGSDESFASLAEKIMGNLNNDKGE